MDLFQNLWARGGETAPTDMSQIKVQPQAVDLSGTFGDAGRQVSYQGAQQGVADKERMNGIIGAMAPSVASAIAGINGRPQQGLMQPQGYQSGARAPEATSSEAISGTRLSDLQKFAQVGGLMSKV